MALQLSRELRPEDGRELNEAFQLGDVTAEGGSVYHWNVEEALNGAEGGGEALQAAL